MHSALQLTENRKERKTTHYKQIQNSLSGLENICVCVLSTLVIREGMCSQRIHKYSYDAVAHVLLMCLVLRLRELDHIT